MAASSHETLTSQTSTIFYRQTDRNCCPSTSANDRKHDVPLGTYLIKEDLSLPQNMFQLCQFKEVPFQSFSILVHFPQLIFQFLERCLLGEIPFHFMIHM
jgi:hypothetical protein